MEKEQQPFANCIVGLNLNEIEIDFLKSLVKIFKFELVEFTNIKNIQYQKNELIFIRDFNPILFGELSDWFQQIYIIGRSTDEQKKILKELGIIRFWDLEKLQLEEISLFKKNPPPKKINIQIIVLTADPQFNRQITSLFQDLGINSHITQSIENFLFNLKNDDPGFIILDWDINEEKIQYISNELKNYKAQKGRIPTLIGIKNFQKNNLFSDLSIIKNFCEILFSKQETLQLLITSLPIDKETERSTEKIKQLEWYLSPNNKILSYTLTETRKLIYDHKIENQKKMYNWLF